MTNNNKHIFVVAVVTLIGALGYGIIIPVLYAYSFQYNLSGIALGFLFSIYSIFEFLFAPIIGILSDKYGRRPLLIYSLIGTVISFFMMAFAPAAIFLFIARALDGITSGNLPVAQAVISDTTEGKDRAKGFGIIGACYGIGLVAGPAIAALTVGISIQLPFIIAGGLSIIAVIVAIVFMGETNQHIGRVEYKKLINWNKLFAAIFDKSTGKTLLVSFLWSFAFGIFILAYQPYSIKILHLTPINISMTFLLFGVVAVISQLFFIPFISKKIGDIRSLRLALLVLSLSFAVLLFIHTITALIVAIILMSLSSTAIETLVQTIFSKNTRPENQGEIMGIGASYISVGQIIGPIIAGFIIVYSVNYSFLAALILIFIGFIISRKIKLKVSSATR